MNKNRRCFFLFFILSVMLITVLPNVAYASPGIARYYSKPTANTTGGGLAVTNPANAYDLNNATFATFKYDSVAAGSFEVKTFNTTSIANLIAFVDFKVKYAASAANTAGDQYRIIYYVLTSGPVILQDWTGSLYSAIGTGALRVWLDQSEPYDGVWNATDIGNIRLIVETKPAGDSKSTFEEYEAWVSVYTYRQPTIWVNPAIKNNPASPFSVTIDIATVDDLYGFEFKLYYNKTILTISTVTLGPLLNNTAGAGNTFGIINKNDNFNATHGRVYVAQSILGDIQGATTNAGTLATLTFTVDGPAGTTTLDLADTKLIGYDFTNKRLTYMTHTATDGTVTVPSGVPEFPMGFALEIALLGVIVYTWRRTRGKRKQPQVLLSKAKVQ